MSGHGVSGEFFWRVIDAACDAAHESGCSVYQWRIVDRDGQVVSVPLRDEAGMRAAAESWGKDPARGARGPFRVQRRLMLPPWLDV